MGAYPDPPGTRIAYEYDGTVVIEREVYDARQVQYGTGSMQTLNSERSSFVGFFEGNNQMNDDPYDITHSFVVLVFPVAIKLQGIYIVAPQTIPTSISAVSSWDNPVEVQTSQDSTNGTDGTWTSLGNMTSIKSGDGPTASQTDISGATANDRYRRRFDMGGVGVIPLSGAGTDHVKAIRFHSTHNTTEGVAGQGSIYHQCHVYGYPDPVTDIPRLDFWDATEDIRWEDRDWGDMYPGQTKTKEVKIKNLSDSLTATEVVLDSWPGSVGATPAPDFFLSFSLDGSSWDTTLTLDPIAPGDVSDAVHIRCAVPATAILSTWAPRILASVGSWSE